MSVVYAHKRSLHVLELPAMTWRLLRLDHKKPSYFCNCREEHLTMHGGRMVEELVR
ncbi:hypothetical protein BH10PLA2_BH10PLA2_27780 [soil metagenome]